MQRVTQIIIESSRTNGIIYLRILIISCFERVRQFEGVKIRRYKKYHCTMIKVIAVVQSHHLKPRDRGIPKSKRIQIRGVGSAGSKTNGRIPCRSTTIYGGD